MDIVSVVREESALFSVRFRCEPILRIVKRHAPAPGAPLRVRLAPTTGIRVDKLGIVDGLFRVGFGVGLDLSPSVFVILFVFPVGFSRGFPPEASRVIHTRGGAVGKRLI